MSARAEEVAVFLDGLASPSIRTASPEPLLKRPDRQYGCRGDATPCLSPMLASARGLAAARLTQARRHGFHLGAVTFFVVHHSPDQAAER